jgi:hypothetical protein
MARLDAKLSAILDGTTPPADTDECFALAEFCQLPCRQFYAASADFYRKAFAADPTLVGELRMGIRYGAACAAAQAGCGKGNDSANDKRDESVHLRRQALDWLLSELDGWRSELKKYGDKARFAVREEMQRWQQDPNLHGVRDGNALAKLAKAEHQEWRKLWEEVEELRQRAAEKK